MNLRTIQNAAREMSAALEATRVRAPETIRICIASDADPLSGFPATELSVP